eukprot:31400_1
MPKNTISQRDFDTLDFVQDNDLSSLGSLRYHLKKASASILRTANDLIDKAKSKKNPSKSTSNNANDPSFTLRNSDFSNVEPVSPIKPDDSSELNRLFATTTPPLCKDHVAVRSDMGKC